MKILSYLLAAAYFYYFLSYGWFALKVQPFYGLFALLFVIAALGLLGIGGKVTRVVAYVVGILWTVYYLYLGIFLFAATGLSGIPIKTFLLMLPETSLGFLTIYCLWKNGKNI